eukprot:s20_g12.t1
MQPPKIRELDLEEGVDASAAFTSAPVAALLQGFENGQDGTLVVCGSIVRSLLGSTGSPGVLSLAVASCANALSGQSAGLLALSAFFALPEVGRAPAGRLPAIDLLGGGASRGSWEQCTIETFTDPHKALSTLVRCISQLLNSSGGRQEEFLGRLPLIFRLLVLTLRREKELTSCEAAPGIRSRSLYFVEAPPPGSGGPIPGNFRAATARLQLTKCVVLHAAPGPLAALLHVRAGCTGVDNQSGICRRPVLPPGEALEVQVLSQPGAGIRQITAAEARRQYPLALTRAAKLRALLLSIRTWSDGDLEVGPVEEALTFLRGFEMPAPVTTGSDPLVELATLTWQQQWQVRHLLRCVQAAEERDQLVSEVDDLVEELAAAEARLAERKEEVARGEQEQEALDSYRQNEYELKSWECERLADSGPNLAFLLLIWGRHKGFESLAESRYATKQMTSRWEAAVAEVEELREEVQEERSFRLASPSSPPSRRRSAPPRKRSDWQLQARIQELEDLVRELQRDQKIDREALRETCDHRDRLQAQLRREAAKADSCRRRTESLRQRLQSTETVLEAPPPPSPKLVLLPYVVTSQTQVEELATAFEDGSVSEVEAVLQQPCHPDVVCDDGRSPVMLASAEGHVEVVRLLLEAGANKNLADNDGCTALMQASVRGHVEVVHLLLDACADGNLSNRRDITALMMASLQGNLEVVRLLLEAGADTTYTSLAHPADFTALTLASSQSHVEVVRSLLDAGTDKNLADTSGSSALVMACDKGYVEVVRLLLEAGADSNSFNFAGSHAFAGLLDAGADKDLANSSGSTALMIACKNGNVEVVRLLLEAGADRNLGQHSRLHGCDAGICDRPR